MKGWGRAVSESSKGGGGAHPRGFVLGRPKKEEGRRRAGRAGKERGAGRAGFAARPRGTGRESSSFFVKSHFQIHFQKHFELILNFGVNHSLK